MTTPPMLDFDRLLAPISSERPTGTYWRENSAIGEIYSSIKGDVDDSRRTERALLTAPSADDNLNPKLPVEKVEPPKWERVVDRAIEAISGKTKDLWIAAWLIEGLARKKGKEFAGMRDGFRLVRELCERYWGQLYPPPDEDSLQEGELNTVMMLAGLNGIEADGTLVTAIRKIDLTDGQVPFEDVEQCLAEFQQLTAVLDAKCGMAPDGRTPLAPPSTQIRSALEACRDKLRPAAGSSEAEAAPEASGATATNGGPAPGRLTRETAFRELLKIADFFEKTEPHSPVSYSLRQAVNWGRMSLPDLLVELIPKSDVREDLFKRTGIPEPKKSE